MTREEIIKAIRQYFQVKELVCEHTFSKWGRTIVAIPRHGLLACSLGDQERHPQGANDMQLLNIHATWLALQLLQHGLFQEQVGSELSVCTCDGQGG